MEISLQIPGYTAQPFGSHLYSVPPVDFPQNISFTMFPSAVRRSLGGLIPPKIATPGAMVSHDSPTLLYPLNVFRPCCFHNLRWKAYHSDGYLLSPRAQRQLGQPTS